jgi:DNA-binding transcriptional ArsR family regulator
MTVGQIVQQVGVGQSTVSHHLKVLAQVRFVLVEHAGTSSRYQVNPNCLTAFPTAADAVMGRTPPERRPAAPAARAAQRLVDPN